MSAPSESTLWKWIARGLVKARRSGTRLHWQRIENLTGDGVPDTYLCVDGISWWLELKRGVQLTNGAIRVDYRPRQVPWLLDELRAGGQAGVLVQVGKDRLLTINNLITIEMLGSRDGAAQIWLQSVSNVRELLEILARGAKRESTKHRIYGADDETGCP